MAFLWPNVGGGKQICPCAFICVHDRMHDFVSAVCSVRAYHLICQHDKLPLVRWYDIFIRWYATQHLLCLYESVLGYILYHSISPIEFGRILVSFCMILLDKVSQKWPGLLTWKFHSIFGMVSHAASNINIVITQPWRHLGAILWFHVIIHIFITFHHKLTKFSTHKRKVMGQHTDNSCPRARHDARVCARKHLKMLKIFFWRILSTTQVILSISKFSVRTCPRAHGRQKFTIFTWFRSWYYN